MTKLAREETPVAFPLYRIYSYNLLVIDYILRLGVY